MGEWIAFVGLSVAALGSGLAMVLGRQPVHCAVVFLVTLLSLAGLFLLLGAEFVGILQIVIYAGAILVLFLFVIMLLHAHSGEGPRVKLRAQPVLAGLLALGLLLGLGTALLSAASLGRPHPGPPPEGFGTAKAVGTTLFARFLLPFEVTSVLLLLGVIGAVVLGRREAPEKPPRERGRERERAAGTARAEAKAHAKGKEKGKKEVVPR